MAITNIEGTVTRTFFNGKGAEVAETFKKRDGSEGSTKWACWFESEHGLSEGDRVKVSGLHSDEISEWEKDGETRRNVKRSLNKARINTQGAASAPASAPEPDPWATSSPEPSQGGYGDDTPF